MDKKYDFQSAVLDTGTQGQDIELNSSDVGEILLNTAFSVVIRDYFYIVHRLFMSCLFTKSFVVMYKRWVDILCTYVQLNFNKRVLTNSSVLAL